LGLFVLVLGLLAVGGWWWSILSTLRCSLHLQALSASVGFSPLGGGGSTELQKYNSEKTAKAKTPDNTLFILSSVNNWLIFIQN
jgi:hypothetical protein